MNASQRWIMTLVENLDLSVGEDTRAAVLGACGARCLPKTLKEKARKLHQNALSEEDFLAELATLWPAVRREGKALAVVYPRCYCSLIKGLSDGLSRSFCLCSVGYVRELFEYATERPVAVSLITSIVGGGSECRFQVALH